MKIFYIIDLIVMFISIIGIIVIDNTKSYGLAALADVGYLVLLLIIFIISITLLVIVSLIYFILRKNKNKKYKH